MIDQVPMDQTMLAVLEIYRHQVTDLDERLESARSDAERQMYRAEEAERQLKASREQREHDKRGFSAVKAERDKAAEKVAKLEGVISSLKIELQEERAAHTATKEQLEGKEQ